MLSAENVSHKYAKQSLSLFNPLKTVSSTLVWHGKEEVAPSLDNPKESVGL